jgi:hypothetical protein
VGHPAGLAQARDRHPVAGREQGVLDPGEVAQQGQRPDLDPVKAEQAVDQYNRGAGRGFHVTGE